MLRCAYCGKPIKPNQLWIWVDGKPMHIGCVPLYRKKKEELKRSQS